MTLNLPAAFLPPDYSGRTIANIPATVAALLDAPFTGLPSLPPDLWRALQPGARRVVLLLVDSLGWQLVTRHRSLFQQLSGDQQPILDQITSVFPSTTVAALSSVWTGVAPASHGLTGLNLFLPDYGTVAQFIHLTPAFGRYPDALVAAGLSPVDFLEAPGFAAQLAASGVPTLWLQGRHLLDTALSQMHGRGVAKSIGFVTAADMFVQLGQLLAARAGQTLFVSAYLPSVDTLMHLRGWDHPAVAAEMAAILGQLQTVLLASLSAEARAGTVFILTADHGQINAPPQRYVLLEDHPRLASMLFMRPTGEPRVPYFYVRHGRHAEALAYLQTHLADAMVALPAEQALAAGLFGPGPHSPRVRERIGDIVGIMRHDHLFLTAAEREQAPAMLGRHGGLTPQEMAVPWLAWRLDG